MYIRARRPSRSSACTHRRCIHMKPMSISRGSLRAANPGSPDAGAPALPPEIEERREYQAPRAGGRFVYVANPKRDVVAVIDSTTLGIRSVEAGDTPTYMTTLPGRDVALVVNVGSNDVTILRSDAAGTRTST